MPNHSAALRVPRDSLAPSLKQPTGLFLYARPSWEGRKFLQLIGFLLCAEIPPPAGGSGRRPRGCLYDEGISGGSGRRPRGLTYDEGIPPGGVAEEPVPLRRDRGGVCMMQDLINFDFFLQYHIFIL